MRFKDSVDANFAKIEASLRGMHDDLLQHIANQQEFTAMASQELTDLNAEVAAVKTVEDGATLGINRLLDMLAGQVQAANDLAELKAGIAQTIADMKGNVAPLADAVAAVPPETP